MMSNTEVIAILICFQFNTYRNFRHYYMSCICGEWKHRPPPVHIQSFCICRGNATLLRCSDNVPTLAYLENATALVLLIALAFPVTHNKQEFNMKVFKGIVAKCKSTIVRYVGLKLRFLCNENVDLVNFVFTRANVDGRDVFVIDTLTDMVSGKIYADKGYISQ